MQRRGRASRKDADSVTKHDTRMVPREKILIPCNNAARAKDSDTITAIIDENSCSRRRVLCAKRKARERIALSWARFLRIESIQIAVSLSTVYAEACTHALPAGDIAYSTAPPAVIESLPGVASRLYVGTAAQQAQCWNRLKYCACVDSSSAMCAVK